MPADETFYLGEGDTGRDLALRCSGSDGVVQDLTGAPVTFRMTPVNGDGVPKIEKPALVDDPPTAGIVRYEFDDEDVDEPGEYRAQMIAMIGGRPVTFPSGPKPDDYVRVVIQPGA